MKNSKNMLTGIGVGAGLLGLAGAGAAGLVIAYKKAKAQDKTIKQLLLDKAKNNKYTCHNCHEKKCVCEKENIVSSIADFGDKDESMKLSSDDVNFLINSFNEENDLSNDEVKDLFDDEIENIIFDDEEDIDNVIAERDHYKNEYEKLRTFIDNLEKNNSETDND